MTASIPNPEVNVLRALCRRPQLIVSLPPDILHDLVPNGKTSLIVQQMFTLHRHGVPVALQSIAETGIATFDELRSLDIECTSRILDDFEANISLVRLYGKKRRTVATLQDLHAQAVRASAFEIDEVLQRISEEIGKINQIGTEIGTVYLEDIAKEYDERDVKETSWRIPTGYDWIDRITNGGPSKNDLWVIYGQFKNGKTQLLRGIINNMADWLAVNRKGEKVVHIAHDGGNKYKHMQYYQAMRIQKYLIEHELPYLGYGKDRNGIMQPNRPLISPYSVEAVRRGWKVDVIIPPETIEVIHQEVEALKASQQRNLLIYDAKTIKHDLDRMIAIFEREYNNGARVFAVDHAGEIGNPSAEEIYKRTAVGAQVLANFAREHDCIVMVLSQINQMGISASSDDKNPRLAGGNEYIVKADAAWRVNLTGEMPNKRIKVTATFGRFSESGNEVSTLLVPHLSSGLIAQDEDALGEDDEDYEDPNNT